MQILNEAVQASLAEVGHAFTAFTKRIAEPTGELSRYYWEESAGATEGADVRMVTVDEMLSTSDGSIYWIPDEVRDDANAGRPKPEDEDIWDAWVQQVGVKTSRVVADRAPISMEMEIWNAGDSELQKIDAALRNQFVSVVSAIRGAPEQPAISTMISTMPQIAITQGNEPFIANLDVYCRCGLIVAPTNQA